MRPISTPSIGLKYVFLLSGAPTPRGFIATLNCNVLDLPISTRTTLLDHWCEHLTAAIGSHLMPMVSVQVLSDPATPLPRWPNGRSDGVNVISRMDNGPHRGTGGALRDAVDRTDAPDDAYALILPAAQMPFPALSALVSLAVGGDADATILLGDHDEPPVGFVVRCGLLREIRATGYVDLKEQALAQFARTHRIRAIRATETCTHRIASRGDYLRAIAAASRTRRSDTSKAMFQSLTDQPYAVGTHCDDALGRLDGRSRFSIVQTGAVVEAGAILHDSVALEGSLVHRDAIVARSVLTAGAIVGPGEVVVDQIVTPSFARCGSD